MSFLDYLFKSKKSKKQAPSIATPITPKGNDEPSAVSPEEFDGVSAIQVVDFINKELPPLAWNRISIRLYKDFQEQGVNLAHINDRVRLTSKQVDMIDNCTQMLFGIRLPNFN